MKLNEDENKQRLERIVRVFDQLFRYSENTRLLGGADEPLYEPASAVNACNRVIFREDYLSSALHEIAHWCIAGPERRKLRDYGYWYNPDGRTFVQQKSFERVEVKPQALEWLFSIACEQPFVFSADNLSAGVAVDGDFKNAVLDQARSWCGRESLPARALAFAESLSVEFGVKYPINPSAFRINEIP